MSQRHNPLDAEEEPEPETIHEEPLRFALGMVFLTIRNLLDTTSHYAVKGITNGLKGAKYLAYAAIVYGAYVALTLGVSIFIEHAVDRAVERIEKQDNIPDLVATLAGIAIAVVTVYALYRVAKWAVEPFKPVLAVADETTGDSTPDLSQYT